MKITTNQVFLHDKRYEADTDYDVDDDLGKYFVNAGWATSDEYKGIPGTTQDVTIEVTDSNHSATGEVS
jgi:hypothetical protein